MLDGKGTVLAQEFFGSSTKMNAQTIAHSRRNICVTRNTLSNHLTVEHTWAQLVAIGRVAYIDDDTVDLKGAVPRWSKASSTTAAIVSLQTTTCDCKLQKVHARKLIIRIELALKVGSQEQVPAETLETIPLSHVPCVLHTARTLAPGLRPS